MGIMDLFLKHPADPKLHKHVVMEKLCVALEKYSALLIKALLNPRLITEKITQNVLEILFTPATYTAPQSVPSLHAVRHATGFVLDSGDECRQAIYDFDFVTGENCQKSKTSFIAWCPDALRVRCRMIYASS